jgi:hypothetical protein
MDISPAKLRRGAPSKEVGCTVYYVAEAVGTSAQHLRLNELDSHGLTHSL